MMMIAFWVWHWQWQPNDTLHFTRFDSFTEVMKLLNDGIAEKY